MLSNLNRIYRKIIIGFLFCHILASYECRRNPLLQEGSTQVLTVSSRPLQSVTPPTRKDWQIIVFPTALPVETPPLPTTSTASPVTPGIEPAGATEPTTPPAEAPTLPTAPTAPTPPPVVPPVVLTDEMVNVAQGPLKIALLKLQKNIKLKEEGYTHLMPLSLERLSSAGMGPIHGAVKLGNVDIVHLLLQNGEKVNRKDADGNTALHLAVNKNSPEMISVLLGYNANKTLKNRQGKTAAQVAEEQCGVDSPVYLLLK